MYYKYDDTKLPLDDFRKLNPTISINQINLLDEDNKINKIYINFILNLY